MKHEVRWNCLTGAVLAWMLSASAVGCMVTGFDMEVAGFARLVLFCGAAAVCGSLCLAFRWGDVLMACAIALAAGYMWHEGTFWEHLAALLRCVSRRYDMAYGWGTVSLGGYAGTGPVDLALGTIGLLAALSVAWVVVRRKSVLCAMPMTVLPLAVCLVVTDTVPSAGWLYLLMLGIVILLLTDYGRRKGKRQSALLTAYLLLPTAAALGLLFLLVPQESYVNRAGQYEEKLIAWAEGFLNAAEDTAGELVNNLVGQSQPAEVDLSGVGPRSQWDYTVMEVTSTRSGTVYLRGQDYDTYSGTGWTASAGRSETFAGGNRTGTLTVKTRATAEVQYLPYYPAEGITLTDGRVANGSNQNEYTFALSDAPGSVHMEDWTECLELPGETRSWAEALVSQILENKAADQSDAQAIAAYVRSSAAYDLNTPRMAAGETDFARWFLEESDTGYCVHFATSAVVLLRAAGIPARYVTGYAASCVSGQTVEVPEKAAHAWAEYYDASRNAWMVLESTPADLTNEIPAETGTTAATAERTEPPTEMEQTRPEKPSETEGTEEIQRPAAGKWEMPKWMKAALWCLLGIAAVLGQSFIRRAYFRNLWNRGTPNERALARYRQAGFLARLLGMKLPGELEELAQKARFSQHTLTDRELSDFGIWYRQALTGLRGKHILLRLYYGIVFAIW